MQPEIRKLTLSTLSPVHIGCGEDFEPGNFVIHDGLLHTLDVETLAAALKEDERKQLANLASEPNPIGKVQAFFGNRSERLSTVSAHQIPVVAGIAREYAQKMGRATQQGNAGRRSSFGPAYPLMPASGLGRFRQIHPATPTFQRLRHWFHLTMRGGHCNFHAPATRHRLR